MLIHKTKDYQKKAKQTLSQQVFNYFFSGSDDEITLNNNVKAFQNIKLYPRILRDMTKVSLKTQILGKQVHLPFGIAPFAMQKLITPQGELVSSKIACQRNTAYGLSMMSTSKISQITLPQYNQNGVKIMQLYFLKNTSYTQKIIKYVQQKGFSALAITVDTQTFGKRRRDQRKKFSPQVTLQVFKDLNINLSFRSQLQQQSFIHSINNQIDWSFIKMIKQKTRLKIILKGIMCEQDAQIAYRMGVDAVWVSNHGGRQLDTSPATIWVLPNIRKKVDQLIKQDINKRKMEIYIDGGIWKGSDIFKCIALGADYVFIGRAFLYSMIDGEKGLNNCFDILTHQLKNTMMLCGTKNIKQINRKYIYEPESKL